MSKTQRSRAVVLALAGVAIMVCGTVAAADWPGHEVKWNQMDGIDGWAGLSTISDTIPWSATSADDFLCTESAWISDVHFAGWTYTGQPVDSFRVTFWTDVPATPDDESHPGDLLYHITFGPANLADPHKIGWQDLGDGTFRINIAQEDWFWQDEGNIYWIGIQGVVAGGGDFRAFYWNFRDRYLDTWGDDAAFESEYYGYAPWANWGWPTDDPDAYPNIYEGAFPVDWWKSADMAFALTGIPEPGTLALLALGGLAALRHRRHG